MIAVSVIIPLYNKSAYIVRAVRSALSQQPPPAEVLVVDDGSTDDGPARLAQLSEDPRLRVLRQPNAGEGAARNRGLSEIRGDLAAFLDADDEWAPRHLAAILELAQAFPHAGLLATGYRAIYGRVQVETAVASNNPVLLRDYFETARGAFCLHISSCAVWKSVAHAAGGFAERAPLGADLEFFARIALRAPVALHPAITGIYYAANSGSALHTHPWTPDPPPVVRLLQNAGEISRSARDYAAWVLLEHALTGLASGQRREALALLRATGQPLGLAASLLPAACLRALVRLRRSRLGAARTARRGAVTNRVVYSNV